MSEQTIWRTNRRADEAPSIVAGAKQSVPPKTFIIGDPKPTDRYTVSQLLAMGLVGIYEVQP